MQLNDRDRRPLYQQLTELFKQELLDGKYKEGEKLPSEVMLSQMYGVSRNTVRGALAQLERERLLVRQQGKGTFVSKKKLSHRLTRSFTEMCKEMGAVPGAKVIKSVIKDAGEQDISFLGLRPGSKIIAIERIRYTDGIPVEFEMSHFPEEFYFLLKEDLNDCSLLALLREKHGYRLVNSRLSIEVIYASYEISKYLSIEKGYPLLLVNSELSDQDGIPRCRCVQYVVGDKFKMVL